MPFNDIVDYLLAGQVVRRASWPEWQVLFFRGKYHLTDKVLVDDTLVPVVSQITLTSLGSDLMADDWEIVRKGD